MSVSKFVPHPDMFFLYEYLIKKPARELTEGIIVVSLKPTDIEKPFC